MNWSSLKRSRLLLAVMFLLSFGLVVAAFEGTLLCTSPNFRQCVEKHEQEDSSGQAEKQKTGAESMLEAFVGCTGAFLDTHGNGITAFATVAIALLTLVLGTTSYWQWQVTERALRETQRANAIDQRAYVYLSNVHLKRYPTNKVGITYPIFNAGKTPAVFAGEYSRANVYNSGVFPEPFPKGGITTTRRSVLIPPGATSSLNPTYWLDLTDEEAESISEERCQIVFHGIIRYRDIFGRWHDTGFGLVYSGALMPSENYNLAWIQRDGFNWFD